MIQANERRRLRHPIALHHRKSHPLEKQFRLGRQRRASANKRPEFPSKHFMNPSESPRPPQKMFSFRRLARRRKPLAPSARFDLSFHRPAQRIQHSRHGNQRRRLLFLDRPQYFHRIARTLQHHRRSHERRHKQRHKLPEHVAERNQRNKPQWMHPPLIPRVLHNLFFNRLQIRQKISVRQHHAPRLRRRSRRIQNF